MSNLNAQPDASPADELRAAATLLRETARKATEGPWTVYKIAGVGCAVNDQTGSLNIPVGTSWVSDADGEWIALMSPAVAEPLAAWLDATAAQFEQDHNGVIPHGLCKCFEGGDPVLMHALDIARAITGRTA